MDFDRRPLPGGLCVCVLSHTEPKRLILKELLAWYTGRKALCGTRFAFDGAFGPKGEANIALFCDVVGAVVACFSPEGGLRRMLRPEELPLWPVGVDIPTAEEEAGTAAGKKYRGGAKNRKA